MKRSIYILLFVIIGNWYTAQLAKDTLENWFSKFYKLVNLEYSEDGKWAAVLKRYANSQDTMMVFNVEKPNEPVGIVKKMGIHPVFMKNDKLLTSGGGNALFWDLKTNKRITYENVKAISPLFLSGMYNVLDKNCTLSLYSESGILKKITSNIQGLPVTDKQTKLFAVQKKGDVYSVLDLAIEKPKKVYLANGKIKSLELSPSGKQLIVVEIDPVSLKQKIVFVNTTNNQIFHTDFFSTQEDFISVAEKPGGESYLIKVNKKFPSENPLIDIWYGNDSNLEKKEYPKGISGYWLWNPDESKVQKLDDKFDTYALTNNKRYLLAFNQNKGHNYITWLPQLDISLYDTINKSYVEWGYFKGVHMGSPEITFSLNGKYLLGSEDGKRWTLYDLESMKKILIDVRGVDQPVFSEDSKKILLGSQDDLWIYDIRKERLYPLNIAMGKRVEVLNINKMEMAPVFNFSTTSVASQMALILKVWDKQTNQTSYLKWINGYSKTVIPTTENYVSRFKFDKKLEHFSFIEENYNLPSQLSFTTLDKKKQQVLYASMSRETQENQPKKKVVSYQNSQKVPLKGVLYYPVNFNPAKKYPMITHIYQVQSNKVNEYLIPDYPSDGFNLRLLLARGYFVYMPDIVYDSRGPGIGALDCVNSAMEAIANQPNIDMKRVGLYGHSHGGYETNFIATHSDRFASYISGAGNSDLMRSYFSYNYNFTSPFYWQFENGQYEMNAPFSENKQLYIENSPIYNVEKVNAPILLWAGKQDENIAWDQVVEFYIGLKRNKKQVIALFYPKQGHDLGKNTMETKDLTKRTLEWWDYFLKGKQNVLWINKQIKKDTP